MRTHRKRLEKLVYSEVFRCSKCGYQTRQPRPFIGKINIGFIFSRYTHCVRCGTLHITRVSKRDHVDSVSKHVFSRVQHVLAAPLNKCIACRLAVPTIGADLGRRRLSRSWVRLLRRRARLRPVIEHRTEQPHLGLLQRLRRHAYDLRFGGTRIHDEHHAVEDLAEVRCVIVMADGRRVPDHVVERRE